MSVNLNKNQSISLDKPSGGGLAGVTMGLGWDVAKVIKKGFFGSKEVAGDPVDLDASAIAYDAQKNPVEVIYFCNPVGLGGAIRHTGDNVTGEGEGDDEQIKVDLSRVSARVAFIVFTVSSYRGQPFSTIENAFCRLVDDTTGKELAKIDLSAKGNHKAVIMSALVRQGNGWSFRSIAEVADIRTNGAARDLDGQIRSLI